MIENIPVLFQWWVMMFALGVIFLPLTSLLFSSFFDKGYIFAKILGMLLISYLTWILASLKIFPFTLPTLAGVLAVFIMASAVISYTKQTLRGLKENWKIILFEEVLFTTGLIFWAYVRAHEPSIHGLEKYMDFGFINSILRADYFPPKDIWMAPFSINYYYFGHLVGAVLTKLSGISPAISYNLILATLFGLTLSASFSIGANLYYFFASKLSTVYRLPSTVIAGLLSAFLVTLGGNLHTIYAFLQTYPVENPTLFWNLPIVFNFQGYWYPNATRFIPFTIHEFPLYSFVVADLHGHVLNIPFVLLTIALLIRIFFSPKLPLLRQLADYLLLSLLIATSLMTNVLDGPIYLLVIFLVLLARQYRIGNWKLEIGNLARAAYSLLFITLGAAILSLPFWLSFKPFGSGIGVLCAPQFLTNIGKIGPLLFEANHCARSPLWMLFILWGFFYLTVFIFLFRILNIQSLFRNLKLEIKNSTDILVLTLALASTIFILIPEFFYVKDIYPAHYRANTVFKFGYQAFIILGLASGYMLTRIISSMRKTLPSTLYPLPLLLFFILVALYPYFAANSFYGNLKNYQGLNGLSYLSDLYPADYQAILWLQNNISGQPVILEAQGDSYTDYARVSANTGLPTVIGWPVHEWLWRGSYDEAGKRGADVTTLYESPDLSLTKSLIQKYNIEYIFVGVLERQKYQKLNELKFDSLGKTIFQSGQTKVYQIIK